MPLTYPLPQGITIYCRVRNFFKSVTAFYPLLNSAEAITKDHFRTQYNQQRTLSCGRDFAGNAELVIQGFVFNRIVNTGIKLF
jgi:hypothetical protein